MALVLSALSSGRLAERLAIQGRSPLRDPLEQAAEIKWILVTDQVRDAFHLGISLHEVFTRLGNLLSVEKTPRTLAGVLAELLRKIRMGHARDRRQFVDAHVRAVVGAHHCEGALDSGHR